MTKLQHKYISPAFDFTNETISAGGYALDFDLNDYSSLPAGCVHSGAAHLAVSALTTGTASTCGIAVMSRFKNDSGTVITSHVSTRVGTIPTTTIATTTNYSIAFPGAGFSGSGSAEGQPYPIAPAGLRFLLYTTTGELTLSGKLYLSLWILVP